MSCLRLHFIQVISCLWIRSISARQYLLAFSPFFTKFQFFLRMLFSRPIINAHFFQWRRSTSVLRYNSLPWPWVLPIAQTKPSQATCLPTRSVSCNLLSGIVDPLKVVFSIFALVLWGLGPTLATPKNAPKNPKNFKLWGKSPWFWRHANQKILQRCFALVQNFFSGLCTIWKHGKMDGWHLRRLRIWKTFLGFF